MSLPLPQWVAPQLLLLLFNRRHRDKSDPLHVTGLLRGGFFAESNHNAGEVQGQSGQHSSRINILGVKHFCLQ